jgi:hypothetical protein
LTTNVRLINTLTASLIVLVLAPVARRGAQTPSVPKTGTVRIIVLGGLESPKELASANVELRGESGKVFRIQSGDLVNAVPYGNYTISVRHNGYLNAARKVTIAQPMEFFAIGLITSPAEASPDFDWKVNVKGKVSPVPSLNPATWVKVSAIYTDFSREGALDENGTFSIRVPPGRHTLSVVQGKQVCDTRTVAVPGPDIRIDLPKGTACQLR